MVWGWWLYVIAIAFAPATLILAWTLIRAMFKLRRTHVIKGQRQWEPTTAERLSPEMLEFVRQTVEGFRQIGFEVVLNARQPEGATGVLDAHRVLLVNRKTNDLALALLVRGKTARSLLLAVVSVFFDERRIVTFSQQQIGFLPKDPLIDSANFPNVSDPSLLWAAHLKRLARAGRDGQQRIAPAPGEEEAYLQSVDDRERTCIVTCGYYWRDLSGDYRLTWKGTVLAICKMMEPIQRWRMRRAQRKADQLWHELGMNIPTPSMPINCAESITSAPGQARPPTEGTADAVQLLSLPYDAVLQPGEIRQSSDAPGLIVRIGLPSVGQLLVSRWPWLLYLAFVVYMLGWTLLRLWFWVKLSSVFWPAFPSRSTVFTPFLCLWTLLLIWELWNTWRSLSQARGTVVLVANEEGVRFANAIGRPHSGFIPRRNFHSFRVAIAGGGGVPPRMHRIVLRSNDGRRPIPLAIGRDPAALRDVANSITRALGLGMGGSSVEPVLGASV